VTARWRFPRLDEQQPRPSHLFEFGTARRFFGPTQQDDIHAGHGTEAISHFKEAQRLAPDNWNYKRQAWLLSDADRDYGTNFTKEVQKLNGKPYYAPRQMPEPANKPN